MCVQGVHGVGYTYPGCRGRHIYQGVYLPTYPGRLLASLTTVLRVPGRLLASLTTVLGVLGGPFGTFNTVLGVLGGPFGT